MKKITKNSTPEFTVFDLAILGIFIVSLAIRLYGAYSIHLTHSEAEFLLSLENVKASGSVTLFSGLMIRIAQFLGINSDLGFRLSSVIMGSLLTVLPALFYREIGKRTALITSLLLAFDPFGITNSIIFTGNIATILFLGLILNAVLHDRGSVISYAILLFVGHGKGLGLFVLIALVFSIVLIFVKKDYFSNFIKVIKDLLSQKVNASSSGLVIILVLILATIFKIPLSNLAADISSFVTGWNGTYQTGNYPIVYLFAIISSIPLIIVTTFIFFLKRSDISGSIKGICAAWLSLSLLVIMIYPKHLFIDLIWISLPLCILASIIIEELFIQNIHELKDEWPFMAILFAIGISFGLNIIAFVYRSIWGLDVTNSLLASIFIGIFAIVILLYKAYMTSVSKAISSIILVIITFGGIIQLSISARAVGSNQKPENEIYWNGYFEGKSIVTGIIDSTKSSLTGTSGKLNVFIDGQAEPEVVYVVNSENIYYKKSDLFSIRPDVVISKNDVINIKKDNYQGQETISNSYPLWTWVPVGSFFSTDYWNWFFFRNNLQYKEYNFIWKNNSLMNNKINNGVN